jgi:hypothetical protein
VKYSFRKYAEGGASKLLALAGVHPYNPLTGIMPDCGFYTGGRTLFGLYAVITVASSVPGTTEIGQYVNSSFPKELKEPQE